MGRACIFVGLIFLLAGPRAQATRYPVQPFDGIPFGAVALGEIFAITDIHSDPDALLAVLEGMGIINRSGAVVRRNFDLVFNGDYIDRGPNVRDVWSIIWKLKALSTQPGSGFRVWINLGNHDFLTLDGDFRYLSKADISELASGAPPMSWIEEDSNIDRFLSRAYDIRFKFDTDPDLRDVPLVPPEESEFRRALVAFMIEAVSPESPLHQLLLHSNLLTRISIGKESVGFLHAGIGEYATEVTPEKANATLRYIIQNRLQYFRALLANQPLPPLDDSWVTAGEGPLWDEMKTKTGQNVRRTFETHYDDVDFWRYLKAWGLTKLAIGHTRVAQIALDLYNSRLACFDTGMANSDGTLTGLRVDGNGLWQRMGPFQRSSGPHPARAGFRLATKREAFFAKCRLLRDRIAEPFRALRILLR